MWIITKSRNKLIFSRGLSWQTRTFVLLISLFPWLAPYELLLRPQWQNIFNFFFLFALLISIGAILVSFGFVCFALYGLNENLEFDLKQKSVSYFSKALLVKPHTEYFTAKQIKGFTVIESIETEGPNYFGIQLTLKNKQIFFGNFYDKELAVNYCQKLLAAYKL